METFQSLLAKKLSDALKNAGLPDTGELTPASDPRFGDYQTNAALMLGKQRGENPRVLAEKIVSQLDVGDLCEPPVVAGVGFINFTLRSGAVAEKTVEVLGDERLGVAKARSPRRIVIDFGSPNVAKPMHVGHIRSTVLGDALARIAQFLGHEVIRDNHIGDWGTQFGMVIYGWKNLLDRQALQRDPLAEIVRIYKDTNERATGDPQVREGCRQELIKLQAGDRENLDIWNECVALSMQDFEHVYKLLDIHYDIQCGESFYHDRLPGVVERLLKSGIAEISDGAVVVFFPENPELADKPLIIRKRDGGFNYATTDLATADYRLETWQPQEIIYITGGPQQLHFRQLFASFGRWQPQARVKLAHVWFGSILGEDGRPFKTRAGESVRLAELLDEAQERAFKTVSDKSPELPEAQRREIARIVGVSAIKYADLLPNRQSDYVFSWDRMLALNGNTAPYLLYAYARIRSIFRKGGEMKLTAEALKIGAEQELALAKHLLNFEFVLAAAAEEYRPNYICNYLYDLAGLFNRFFENCPVLKAEPEVRNSRLVLSDLAARVLKQGLDALGIQTLEQM